MTVSSARPLLPTKHSVPPRRPGAVARRRLQDAADTRLCVVVAPDGWARRDRWQLSHVVRTLAAAVAFGLIIISSHRRPVTDPITVDH